MQHEVLEALPVALLQVSLMLAGAVLVALVTQRVNIPLTVVLAVVGLIVVQLQPDLSVAQMVQGEGLQELLVNLFLPILIFEAALGLSTREFMRNLVSITALATVALLISAALVGIGLHYLLDMPVMVALLFGVLISATDPVAVVAIFREVGVPKRLLTIVEGESMLNDGVAIVLYKIMLIGATGGAVSVASGSLEFLEVAFVGGAIGAVIGIVAVMLMPLLQRLSAAAMSVAVAYGSFVLAENLHVSGVMATVAAGIAVGGMLESRAEATARDLLRELWESLGFIANALLFLFIGLALDFDLIRENLAAIGIGVAAVLIARPLAVVPLVELMERMKLIPEVGHRNSAVIVWGGLRGGVALALALAVPAELAQRDQIIAMTGGVVLATLLVNATTIPMVVHALGLDRPSKSDEYLSALARLRAVQHSRDQLASLGFSDRLVDAHLSVAEADATDQLERASLNAEEAGNVLVLRGLHIQREAYQGMSDAGLLPPISARTLLEEIDTEIEELERGGLRVDAARRAFLPWYGRLHRWVLGILPEPLGEDLTKVAYIEVSARRLAARKAAEELELFKQLPGIDQSHVESAQRTFRHWEEAGSSRLEELEMDEEVDRQMLHRRQAKALSRIAVADVLNELVDEGVLSRKIADQAGARVSTEVDEAGT